MSRIHEALKKAQELRSAAPTIQEAARREPVPAETILSGRAGGGTQDILPPIRPAGPLASSGYLRFDDLEQRCARPGWKLNADYATFSSGNALQRCTEQFRTLRTRLYRLREEHPIRSVMITSTLAGEGKSFVALNLAQAIVCQKDRRVLLIDADLRASRLHVRMGAPSAPGLSDYLGGEADEYSIVQGDTKENFFFIPAGKAIPNPAELLANNQLKVLLDRLAPAFEWVILDAPPVLPVSDASVLVRSCDGVIFVVRAGAAPFDLAQTACAEFTGKNLLGVVLNGVEEEARINAYSYYAGNGMDKV